MLQQMRPAWPGWHAEAAATLRLAGPLALANILQMLTYAIDVMFIARLGAGELAAAALATSVFGLVLWTLGNLVAAVAPVMAADLGRGGPALRAVRRAMRMGMWLAVAASGVGMIACLGAGPLMRATGQPEAIAAMAGEYMAILLLALLPMLIANALRQFVATMGRPEIATGISAAGIGINAFCNWVFIFGNLGVPAMGLQGAAIATVLSALAALLLYVLAISGDRRLARYRIFGRLWRPDWPRLLELVRIGVPMALTVLAEAGVFAAAAFLMGRIGALELAAHSLALQLASMAFMVPMGVAQAATIRVGYASGAGDRAAVRRAGWCAVLMALAFMSLTASAMLAFPEFLLAIYLDPADPGNGALVAIGTRFLLVAAAFQLFDGVQVVAAGALRGLKDTRVPMWIAVFSYWVPGFGLAAGLGLATPLAGLGVWIGLAAGLVCASVLLLWRWHRREALGLMVMAKNPDC